MASSSKQVVVVLAVVLAAVACLASLTSATQWVVGDECGWKEKFEERNWANGKTFVVGDTLQFVYPKDKHTVVQVGSEDDFQACNKDANQLGAWCSGNDVVTLDRPGRMWFICTKGKHCSKGMKLAIDVVAAPFGGITAPPPPTPVWPWPFPGTSPPTPTPAWPYPPGTTPPPPPPMYGGWPYPVPASLPPPPPPSAAMRNPVGGAVAVAAAAVVVAALAF